VQCCLDLQKRNVYAHLHAPWADLSYRVGDTGKRAAGRGCGDCQAAVHGRHPLPLRCLPLHCLFLHVLRCQVHALPVHHALPLSSIPLPCLPCRQSTSWCPSWTGLMAPTTACSTWSGACSSCIQTYYSQVGGRVPCVPADLPACMHCLACRAWQQHRPDQPLLVHLI
jgi:hypothetical protein